VGTSTTENPPMYALLFGPSVTVHGLLDYRVRSVGHIRQFLLREGHRAVIERDQIPRHLMTPLSAAWAD